MLGGTNQAPKSPYVVEKIILGKSEQDKELMHIEVTEEDIAQRPQKKNCDRALQGSLLVGKLLPYWAQKRNPKRRVHTMNKKIWEKNDQRKISIEKEMRWKWKDDLNLGSKALDVYKESSRASW